MEWIREEILECYSCYIDEERLYFDICTQHKVMFNRCLEKRFTPKWINVEDRLPSDEQLVIVYKEWKPSKINTIGISQFSNGIFAGILTSTVTYWMALPEPPCH